MSDIESLLAKDAITEVIHRVARGTDRLDHDLIVSGYWPDGFDDQNSFRGGPVEFADWVLKVLPHFQATHHLLGQCRIELDGDERRDDEWRIAMRTCAFDWAYTLSSTSVWNFEDDFTVGSRDRNDITYTRF